ncbi:MAG TPA: alanine dehydrogenase [Actinobacteria bacterium]|nr:alanine dehydrogenase [Actinomycetota bacterium]
MIVGVPTEIKTDEFRVAITPVGVRELTGHGHRVLVQAGAGNGSSIPDEAYRSVGAEIVPDAATVFGEAEMILKVKEPQPAELAMLRPGQILFTYLHLAAYPDEARRLIESGVVAIAYETVQLPTGDLPLLAPMSEIAGRMAAQAGAHHLEKPAGGRGLLIGGVPGVPPARVVVVGAGNAGRNAAAVAAGMGAEVLVLDLDVGRLRHIDEVFGGRIVTVRSSMHAIDELVPTADLVVGAVLVAGARAPVVVREHHVEAMRPGSVVVDISIDQGGCIETSRETNHEEPTYLLHDVVHYAVGNIPGAVPHTSTYALTNATLPYAVAIADGLETALRRYPELLGGVNVAHGKVTHPAVAEFLGTEAVPPLEAIGAG